MDYFTEKSRETIAAVATPPGEGGVAVIRISGEEAIAITAKIFSGPVQTYASHTAHLGKILDASGEPIDEVLLLVMRAPRSYTGEETVEIHCHGGSFITRRVLERVLEVGARAARPGEFTLRAFLNQKIDLAQAEAVQQLIGAKNALGLAAAKQQLEGRLSQKITAFQKALLEVAAILEAWVDFPEEDLEFATMQEVIDHLVKIREEMQVLCATFHEGKKIHHGIGLCLVGPPNAGKSSLMNALLGKERAIVTEIAGTTRDLLEEELQLGQLHFRLVDTAGIRETEEKIEKEGIRRSKAAMQSADLILLLIDASRPLCEEGQALLAGACEKTLIIYNKIDLLESIPEGIAISAKTRHGLDLLKQKIEEKIWKNGVPSKEEIVLTNARHQEALTQAIEAMGLLIENLESGVSAEFVAHDMHCVLSALGQIIGMEISEEILSTIFSKFCIGK